MAQVQITDVVVPAEFTQYQIENSMVSTALFQSGVVLPNGEMGAQLNAGAQSFTVPFWSDIPDVEADITNDNPASRNRLLGGRFLLDLFGRTKDDSTMSTNSVWPWFSPPKLPNFRTILALPTSQASVLHRILSGRADVRTSA